MMILTGYQYSKTKGFQLISNESKFGVPAMIKANHKHLQIEHWIVKWS